MDNMVLLVLGVLLSVLGVVNMTGNISTIHSYNRRKVKDEDVKKYGMAVGLGTLIIGVALIVAFVLELLALIAVVPLVIFPAVIAGLAFVLYGQFKYNRGIF